MDNEKRRSPDQVEMDEVKEAQAKALGIESYTINFKEVLGLVTDVVPIIEGKSRRLVIPALITLLYFTALPNDTIPKPDEIAWFLDEASLAISALLQADGERRRGIGGLVN